MSVLLVCLPPRGLSSAIANRMRTQPLRLHSSHSTNGWSLMCSFWPQVLAQAADTPMVQIDFKRVNVIECLISIG
jgi:hypothetical protein